MSHLHLPAMPCDFFETRFKQKGEDDLELRFKASSSFPVGEANAASPPKQISKDTGRVAFSSIAGSLLLKERLKDALLVYAMGLSKP